MVTTTGIRMDEEMGGDEVDGNDDGKTDGESRKEVNYDNKGVSIGAPMYLNGNRSSELGTILKRELRVPRMMK
jgi:hypothetical protein